jgi:hypothetical protein
LFLKTIIKFKLRIKAYTKIELKHDGVTEYLTVEDNAFGYWNKISGVVNLSWKNLESAKIYIENSQLLGKGIDVDWSKTDQGIEAYNTKAVTDFKEKGISHVRIRTSQDATEKLFAGLDKQIKDCLDNRIIPVIAY